MENKIEIFKSDEFGSVRIVMLDGEPWFVGKDVATILGYTNPQRAIRDHIDDEDKGVTEMVTPGGKQNVPIINESGLYSLILSSKLPTARKFKRWVTAEILPCIRRNSAYMTDSLLNQVMQKPELILLMAEKLLKERADNDGMRLELSVTRPKAEYYDAFVHPEDCTNIRATAKELQVSERWFCRFLLKTGFMYRCPAGTLMPYNNPKNDGLFRVKDYVKNGHKGAYTLITPKGKDLLRQLICDSGEQAD
ncbi:MAG: phage antirepressor [Oscillospiraceae bacterium]|nr:phage antirepressor [Oscillospiraceae bacterium]